MVAEATRRRRPKPGTSVQLAPDQTARLDEIAAERRISRSALIRQAVDLLLDGERGDAPEPPAEDRDA